MTLRPATFKLTAPAGASETINVSTGSAQKAVSRSCFSPTFFCGCEGCSIKIPPLRRVQVSAIRRGSIRIPGTLPQPT